MLLPVQDRAHADEGCSLLRRDPVVLARSHGQLPQAVLLGQAKVMGDFNDTARKYNLHKTGPLARDFTLKMVWALERKRALYCGANHGVPHRLNDVTSSAECHYEHNRKRVEVASQPAQP